MYHEANRHQNITLACFGHILMKSISWIPSWLRIIGHRTDEVV